MINTDEDALICDLAETYHIYNYLEFSPTYIATLSAGLPDHSRIKLKIANSKLSLNQMLMAQAVDALNLQCWMNTKDAQNGWNRPKSIFKALTETETDKETLSFESGEDFLEAFKAIAEKNNG